MAVGEWYQEHDFLKGRAPKSKRPQSNSSNAAPITHMHKGSPIPFYSAHEIWCMHWSIFLHK